jgi:sec-independent protein translocase protein TatB
MEILGIGPEELALILIIALILLGPKDMQKAGLTIGKWLRRIITSDGWKIFQQTSREIQSLPTRLMREAQLDELKNLQNDINRDLKETVASVQQSAHVSLPVEGNAPNPTETILPANKILPPPPPADTNAGEEKHA